MIKSTVRRPHPIVHTTSLKLPWFPTHAESTRLYVLLEISISPGGKFSTFSAGDTPGCCCLPQKGTKALPEAPTAPVFVYPFLSRPHDNKSAALRHALLLEERGLQLERAEAALRTKDKEADLMRRELHRLGEASVEDR